MRGLRVIFAVALVVAAVAVTGCGGDDKGKGIPAATATALDTQLNGVEARLAQGSAGACRDILDAPDSRGPNKKKVEELIDSMPDDVDSDVKSALEDSFGHLWDLVQQECDDKAAKQDTNTNTNTTPTDTTPTDTTPTDTTPTDTTPTDTAPTDTTTSPDQAPLPNDGNGNGNGNGGGVGQGGGASPNAGAEG